eukprot:jgi/Chrzof1/10247/Cz04g34050.t1
MIARKVRLLVSRTDVCLCQHRRPNISMSAAQRPKWFDRHQGIPYINTSWVQTTQQQQQQQQQAAATNRPHCRLQAVYNRTEQLRKGLPVSWLQALHPVCILFMCVHHNLATIEAHCMEFMSQPARP